MRMILKPDTGCSPEEMFSAEFYNTRVTQFYDFYKREILSKRGRINEGMKTLKRLEDRGILQAVITRDIYSLPKRQDAKGSGDSRKHLQECMPEMQNKISHESGGRVCRTPKCTNAAQPSARRYACGEKW